MLTLLQSIRQSDFLKHNAIFLVGSVLVGALNYLYYPLIGRLMSPSDFGELQVIVSLFLQFTIFLNVLGMVTINIVANTKTGDRAHHIIFEVEKLAAYVALAVLALSIVFGELIRQQLQFSSMLPVVALALALLVSVPLTFRSAYARAEKRFGIASVSQLIGAAVKVAASAAFVIAGLGVLGAVGGIIVAQCIAFLYAARWAARIGFKRPKDTHYGTLPDIKAVSSELRYAAGVFVALLSVTLIMSIDAIVVKYYFDAHTAGLYAGVATVARIVFFVAVPIAQVMMSMVKMEATPKQNRQFLLKSLGLTIAVSLPILLACMMTPDTVIKLLMGQQYVEYANILPMLVVVVFIISIVNLIFTYYLALRHTTIMLIGIIGLVVFVSLILWQHDTLHAVVYSMLLGSIFTLLTTGIYVLVNLKREVRAPKQND